MPTPAIEPPAIAPAPATNSTSTAPPPPSKGPAQTWEVENPFLSAAADFEKSLEDGAEPGATIIEEQPEPEVQPAPETAPEPPAVRTGTPEPSRKMLAQELATQKAEFERVATERDEHLKKVGEYEAKVKELETQLQERDTTFVKERTPEYDWRKDKEVAPLRQEIGQIIEETAAELSREVRSAFQSDLADIIRGYDQHLRAGDLAEFRRKLTETFGEDAERVMQAAKAIHQKERAAVANEQRNRQDWSTRVKTEHDERRRKVSSEVGRIGKWSDEEIAANPDHPDAILTKVFQSNPKALEAAEPILRHIVALQAGLAPLPPDATPEQIAQARQTEGYIRQLKELGPMNSGRLQLITGVMKTLYSENQKLRTRVEQMTRGNSPDARFEPGTTPEPDPTKLLPGQSYDEAENPFARRV